MLAVALEGGPQREVPAQPGRVARDHLLADELGVVEATQRQIQLEELVEARLLERSLLEERLEQRDGFLVAGELRVERGQLGAPGLVVGIELVCAASVLERALGLPCAQPDAGQIALAHGRVRIEARGLLVGLGGLEQAPVQVELPGSHEGARRVGLGSPREARGLGHGCRRAGQESDEQARKRAREPGAAGLSSQ